MRALLPTLLLAVPAAATTLQGPLTANTTWSPAGNPYVLTGDVTVPPGITLTIAAGTHVIAGTSDALMANFSTSRIELAVKGTLIVAGTAASPVTFTSSGAGAGQWFGVRITEGSGSRIEHAKIDEAFYGLTSYAGGTFTDVDISDCSYSCVWLADVAATLTRIHGARCGDAGLEVFDANVNLSHSSFVESGHGADFRGSGVLDHLTFARNSSRGMWLEHRGDLTIKNSIFAANGYTGVSRSSDSTGVLRFLNNDSWNTGSPTHNISPGVGTNGNISVDPQFMSATDLRLQPTSPCRGAGTDGSDLGAFPAPAIIMPPPQVTARLELTPAMVSLAPGGVTTFVAKPLDASGNPTADQATFSVANPAAGSITAAGVFTAGSTAGAWSNAVVATVGNVTATAHVTVLASGGLSQLIVTPGSATVSAGNTLAFTAYGKDPAGASVAVAPTWLVMKGGGTVNGSGVFTASTTPGTYLETVQVLAGGLSATATVVVVPGPVVSVLVDPVTPLIQPGQRLQYAARVLDAHGNPVSTPISWSVDPGIGSIDVAGVFTAGTREGDFPDAVSATARGITGTASITIARADLPRAPPGMQKWKTESRGCGCGAVGDAAALWLAALFFAAGARRKYIRRREAALR